MTRDAVLFFLGLLVSVPAIVGAYQIGRLLEGLRWSRREHGVLRRSEWLEENARS